MLSAKELETLFERHKIPDQGRKHIQWIRENAPIRGASAGTKNVVVRYSSRKMGFALEAEAFNTEYATFVTLEYDEATYEYYGQPTQLKITYLNSTRKKVSPYITPDIFQISQTGFTFYECKTEADLERLAEELPYRFQKDDEGNWRSPPAEEAAKALGCRFEVRSSKDNNWALIENLEFLADYFLDACRPVSPEVEAMLKGYFASTAWATLAELVNGELGAKADWIYALIVRGVLYFDLSKDRICDFEHAIIFRDRVAADAYSLFARTQVGLVTLPGGPLDLEPWARFMWDGRTWEIANLGEHQISAHAIDGTDSPIVEFSSDQLAMLAKQGKISVPSDESARQQLQNEAHDMLRQCSQEQVEIASQRYQVLFGSPDPNTNSLAKRSKRAKDYWRSAWRGAEQRFGYGLLGLVPNLRHTQGNKRRKLPEAALSILAEVVKKFWGHPKRKRASAILGAVIAKCRELGLAPPSLNTIRSEIKHVETHENLVLRLGEKAAYSEEPEYLSLEYTTPRHGTRPFHIGHMDHTPVDIVLIDRTLTTVVKQVWLSLLTDAYSRKVLAYYFSVDPPSYRTNMMLVRECVRRHGRLPRFVVVDHGPEFEGTYFETVLAFYGCHKKERPKSKARFGSLIERMFKTSTEQFIYNLLGNTQAYKNWRQISPEVDPAKHAVWIFERLADAFGEYVETVYHKNFHATLGCSPEQKYVEGMSLGGYRKHTLIPYNKQFLIETCPTTYKGKARVTQHGVKINYIFYRAPVLHSPGVKGAHVPVRYDPFNIGIAYGFVNGQWHDLYSEYYSVLSQYSEREIRIVSTYLHLQKRYGDRARALNAERLATFLISKEGEELLQVQHKREAESKPYLDAINVVPDAVAQPDMEPRKKPVGTHTQPSLLEDFDE